MYNVEYTDLRSWSRGNGLKKWRASKKSWDVKARNGLERRSGKNATEKEEFPRFEGSLVRAEYFYPESTRRVAAS